MTSLPKALSRGEETFWLHCKVHGLTPEREYCFHLTRKFRFDFCFIAEKLAVEIEGGTMFGMSRHSRGTGFEQDARKYNLAAKNGWRVFRYTPSMVDSGEAIADVLEVLQRKTAPFGTAPVL